LPAGGELDLRVGGGTVFIHPAPDASPATVQVTLPGRQPKTYQFTGDKPLRIRIGSAESLHLRAEDEIRVDHWQVRGGGNAAIWLLPLLCLLIPLLIGGVFLLIRDFGD
jgi:hypothetical protein